MPLLFSVKISPILRSSLYTVQLRESVRQTVKTIVESLVEPEAVDSILHKPASPVDFDCLEAVVDRFSSACFPIGKVHIIIHRRKGKLYIIIHTQRECFLYKRV